MATKIDRWITTQQATRRGLLDWRMRYADLELAYHHKLSTIIRLVSFRLASPGARIRRNFEEVKGPALETCQIRRSEDRFSVYAGGSWNKKQTLQQDQPTNQHQLNDDDDDEEEDDGWMTNSAQRGTHRWWRVLSKEPEALGEAKWVSALIGTATLCNELRALAKLAIGWRTRLWRIATLYWVGVGWLLLENAVIWQISLIIPEGVFTSGVWRELNSF